MGWFERVRALFSKKAAAAPSADEPQFITVYDGYGRQYQITRTDWEANVLPGSIEQARDDAESLYSVIAGALQDGFSQQLLGASQRLLDIDTDRERSHVIRGFVLLRAGDLAGAENVLNDYIHRYGPTGTVLTNLAKVYASKGQQAEAEQTLQQAIQLDPNQENGLL